MNWPNIAEHWPQILGGLALVVAGAVGVIWRIRRAFPKDIPPDEARELHYPRRNLKSAIRHRK